jgi:exo-1,4-beta-D-glucosaminidase
MPGVTLHARVLNLDMSEQFKRDTVIDIAADSSMRVFTMPVLQTLSPTFFVDLRLTDSAGKIIGSNFYWLSTHPDVLNLDSTTWYVTPVKSYADYHALSQLAKTTVRGKLNVTAPGSATVTLTNTGKTLAFFTRLQLMVNGAEVTPVFWEDNYVSLLPGETRKIAVRYTGRGAQKPTLKLTGWNL